VSSPGVDEPLKLIRQYKKNIGRSVEVTMADDEKKEGILKEVTDDAITIEQVEGKGKKAVTLQTAIDFAAIKQTKVLIKF
jgi:ribosome maturation factor RimP